MPAQYHISLPDPSKARGNDPDLSFHSQAPPVSPKSCRMPCAAARCSNAGRPSSPTRMRWNRRGVTDPEATVTGEQKDLRINLVATTRIDSDVFKQRLRLLAGSHWELRGSAGRWPASTHS